MVGPCFRPVGLVLFTLLTTSACSQSSTESTAPEGPCRVSDLLVPDCGAWLGATTPSADGTFDYERGLQEYEAIADNDPDVLHFYERGARRFPTAEQEALAARPGHQRSILHFSWKPEPTLSWRQIADGEADATIATVASSLIDYPHRMFLTVHHEPEDDVIVEPSSGMTAADYVAMYRHVVQRLRSLGVENLVFVMTYTGFERWSTIVDDLYPGDDVVDWLGYDPYGFAAHTKFSELLNQPAGEDWPGFYDWAVARAPGKPLMIAEWGFDLELQQEAAELVSEAPGVLRSNFPMIKALVYWNDRNDRIDVRLDESSAAGQGFAETYRRLANDPYFNTTRTDGPP
jgi:hypothetical protein